MVKISELNETVMRLEEEMEASRGSLRDELRAQVQHSKMMVGVVQERGKAIASDSKICARPVSAPPMEIPR